MKIPEGSNPSLVLSTDETRWIINHALVRDGHLIATDGRRLLVQAIEHEEADARRELPIGSAFLSKAFEAAAVYHGCDNPDCEDGACSREVASRRPIQLEVGDDTLSACLGDGIVGSFRPEMAEPAKFPNWAQVVPPARGNVTIRLNARFLLEIVQALGCRGDQVCIQFDPDSPHQPAVISRTHGRPVRAVDAVQSSGNAFPAQHAGRTKYRVGIRPATTRPTPRRQGGRQWLKC